MLTCSGTDSVLAMVLACCHPLCHGEGRPSDGAGRGIGHLCLRGVLIQALWEGMSVSYRIFRPGWTALRTNSGTGCLVAPDG